MIFSTYMVSSTKHILTFKFNMGIAELYANKKFWVDFHVFLPWMSVSSANLLSLTILSLVLFPFTVSDSSNLISFLRQNLILSRWPCFLLHWEKAKSLQFLPLIMHMNASFLPTFPSLWETVIPSVQGWSLHLSRGPILSLLNTLGSLSSNSFE